MNLRATLEQRIAAALQAAGAEGAPALVAPSARPQFGDYQANGCMAAAKKMGAKPRQLAEQVAARLDLSDIAEKVEVAGAGFLNIFLRREWVETQLGGMAGDERLSVPAPETPQTVVVDYSGPNLAKEMHVGHLRSTIIGDALARTLFFCEHNVKLQNHVGDWGTQFGMLTAYLEREEIFVTKAYKEAFPEEPKPDIIPQIRDLEENYREAKALFDTNPDFAQKSREYVVKLQSGDPHVRHVWEKYIEASRREFL
jgi:arginyl-tRNA synthetase